MRSLEKPKPANKYKASLPRPPNERRKLSRQLRSTSVTEADEPALPIKLMGLIQEHRALDGAISMLLEARILDQFLITRLKKLKLQLKDEIARIQGTLHLTNTSVGVGQTDAAGIEEQLSVIAPITA
jgi:hypothetical protein